MNDTVNSFVNDLNLWNKNKIMSPYLSVSREDIMRYGIVIFGGSIIGCSTAANLLDCGITPSWIVDKNKDLCGTMYGGIEIRPVESLAEIGECFVLLASTHINGMRRECEKFDVKKWILTWQLREFCPMPVQWGITMTEDLFTDKLVNSIEIFEDEKSRSIYKAFIKYHFLYDNDFSSLQDPIEYFPEDLRGLIAYRRFVDCGAFVGDTFKIWQEEYLSSNQVCGNYDYWAIEPGENSFEELTRYAADLAPEIRQRVHLFNTAVGARDDEVSISGSASGVKVTTKTDNKKILIRSLDDILKNSSPTVIKADVEGSEMDLLKGAEETIHRCRPTLMISVYHKFTDIYEIPLAIQKMNLGYRLYLRHAPSVFTDTTCYAIAE